jgi:hypothetical protein
VVQLPGVAGRCIARPACFAVRPDADALPWELRDGVSGSASGPLVSWVCCTSAGQPHRVAVDPLGATLPPLELPPVHETHVVIDGQVQHPLLSVQRDTTAADMPIITHGEWMHADRTYSLRTTVALAQLTFSLTSATEASTSGPRDPGFC